MWQKTKKEVFCAKKTLPHFTEQPLFMHNLDSVKKDILRNTAKAEIQSYWGEEISL